MVDKSNLMYPLQFSPRQSDLGPTEASHASRSGSNDKEPKRDKRRRKRMCQRAKSLLRDRSSTQQEFSLHGMNQSQLFEKLEKQSNMNKTQFEPVDAIN